MSSLPFKEKIHLKADNEHETAQDGLFSFVCISRSGMQILKRNAGFKAVELIDLRFPFTTDDALWGGRISDLVESAGFQEHVAGTELRFAVIDTKATIVPSSIFAANRKNEHFRFLFGESDGVAILDQPLSNSDAVGVFSVPTQFTEVVSTSMRSAYLDWLDTLSTSTSKLKAHLIVREKQFGLAVFKDGALLVSNWFEYGKAEDILYYLMATLESVRILHSEVEVVLSGEVDKGDEVHNAIGRFISKLSFAKRPKNLTYSYSFKDVPEHSYPFLFSAACA